MQFKTGFNQEILITEPEIKRYWHKPILLLLGDLRGNVLGSSAGLAESGRSFQVLSNSPWNTGDQSGDPAARD